MASCGSCGGMVLLGGERSGGKRFCDKKCLARCTLFKIANELPGDLIQRQVDAVHKNGCPQCRGPGPIDVHTSYRVWSAVYVTSWSSHPKVSCRRCGTRHKIQDALFSLLLGWWGFPLGFIFTPVQIIRNLAGIARKHTAGQASQALEEMVRLDLARRIGGS